MRYRLLIILALVMFSALLPVPSVFAGGNDYSIKIVGRLDSNTQHRSRDTYTVEFQVKTSNGSGITGNWDCELAYDTSVFELISMDGANSLSDAGISLDIGASYISIPASKGFSSLFSADWVAMLFATLSSDGKTGFVSLQALSIDLVPIELKTFTALQTVRFAFKDGKSINDLTSSTIRFASQTEMKTLPGVSSQILLTDGKDYYEYGTKNGDPDTLLTPTFELETGDSNAALPSQPPNPTHDSSSSDFEYTLSDGEVTITGYTGNDIEIYVPTEIDGYPVVAVENGAFVNLPDNATIFASDESLKSTIEESGIDPEMITTNSPHSGFPIVGWVAIILVIVVVGGLLYYIKIIKPKSLTKK